MKNLQVFVVVLFLLLTGRVVRAAYSGFQIKDYTNQPSLTSTDYFIFQRSTNYYNFFIVGHLGTNIFSGAEWTNLLNFVTSIAATQASNATNGITAGQITNLINAQVGTNVFSASAMTYFASLGGGGSGNGFPLTANGNANQFAITNLLFISFYGGSVITNSPSSTNAISVSNTNGQFVLQVNTNGLVILGTNGQFKLDTSGNLTILATISGTGANFSGLTATSIIGTDGSKNLKSVILSGLTYDGTTLTATGSQTPWFQTINGNQQSLTNPAMIQVNGTNGPASTTVIDGYGMSHYSPYPDWIYVRDANSNMWFNANGSNHTAQISQLNQNAPIFQYLGLDAQSNIVAVTNSRPLSSTVLSIVRSDSAPSPSTNYTFHTYDITSTNFMTLGGKINPTTLGAFGAYFGPLKIQTGGSGATNFEVASAVNVTFGVDGSNCIVRLSGNGETWSVWANGVDQFITNTVPNDGAEHWYTLNFATYERRTITLNNAWPFLGVYTAVTNGFYTTAPIKKHKLAIMGDSFVEQSYEATANSEGLVSQLQGLWPNIDSWGLGEGGTGWLNPGVSSGTNFLGRIGDFAAVPGLEYAIVFGGINDTAYCTNTSVTNICYSAITNFINQFQIKYPNVLLAVIGPQWPRIAVTPGDQNVFNESILLSNACAVYNVPYGNPTAQPWVDGNVAAANSGNADVYTRSADTTHPTIPFGAQYYAGKIATFITPYFGIYPGVGVLEPPNPIVPGILTATNGFTSWRSNSVGPVSFTFPASNVNWTNPINCSIQVYIDNSAVTGTVFKKNGTQIFSSIIGDMSVGLQAGEYFSETYTVGTPSGRWSPFP